ncbi:hypothetical protein J6590_052565 [Homalodisca vitripennis]|nr:hypothetical protein J6590_052565 [Homalodisca vitripennis]
MPSYGLEWKATKVTKHRESDSYRKTDSRDKLWSGSGDSLFSRVGFRYVSGDLTSRFPHPIISDYLNSQPSSSWLLHLAIHSDTSTWQDLNISQ